tara:strand:+ start:45 stop:197 length:153 start_codon:yes stop_codon:yes gene_type:complete
MNNEINNSTIIEEKMRAINNLIDENKNIREIKRVNESQIDLNNLEKIIKR